MRKSRFALFCLILLTGMLWLAVPAQTQAANPAAPVQQAGPQTTPEAETVTIPQSRGASPILAVLVLGAPLGWLVWKSARQKKLQKVKAACCVPVPDEE